MSVYRSLGVTVVSGRKFVSHSNLYATVHVGGGFGRTATMWNCKVIFFFSFSIFFLLFIYLFSFFFFFFLYKPNSPSPLLALSFSSQEQPVWKSHFDFRLPRNLDRYTLYTTLWEISDKIGRDAPVGQAKIPLCKFVSQVSGGEERGKIRFLGIEEIMHLFLTHYHHYRHQITTTTTTTTISIITTTTTGSC